MTAAKCAEPPQLRCHGPTGSIVPTVLALSACGSSAGIQYLKGLMV